MKNAIIIHGKANQAKYLDPAIPSPSNSFWIPWLQKQLLLNGIHTQTPEMPAPWKPDYLAWTTEFDPYDITSDTILIGHSCGAGFLLRWMCEHKDICVDKVVLVAPWIDPDRTGDTGTFFEFDIDSRMLSRASKITIFNSDDDFPGVQTSVKIIRDALPGVGYREFKQNGHFTGIAEFPYLCEELLS